MSNMLLPYIALFLRSVEEFCNARIVDEEIEKQVYDLRNGLKLFSDRYSKAKQKVLRIDEEQDNYFKSQLRFSFTKNLNIHYNLGIYTDPWGNIIGNTQMISDYLNLSQNLPDEERDKYIFNFSKEFGKGVSKVYNTFYGKETERQTIEINDCPCCYYADANTNRKNTVFTYNCSKELNLEILYILSTIGFVEHVMKIMLPKNNLCLFRLEYITAHNVKNSIERITKHFDNDIENQTVISELNKTAKINTKIFNSDFRNCIMHYKLHKENEPTVNAQNFDITKKFFGLVESCFDGMSFEIYEAELTKYLNTVEESLKLWFLLKTNRLS